MTALLAPTAGTEHGAPRPPAGPGGPGPAGPAGTGPGRPRASDTVPPGTPPPSPPPGGPTHPTPTRPPAPPRPRLTGLARRALVVAACTLAAIVTAPAPAAHAAAPTVYIESYASTAWPIAAAKTMVDSYTGSYLTWGRCRTGSRCIRIYERTIRTDWAAVTYNWSWGSQIYLNPQRRSYPWSAKRSIVTHELAHAHGVTWHTTGCTDVMNANVFCAGGVLPPYRFADDQRAVLWRH